MAFSYTLAQLTSDTLQQLRGTTRDEINILAAPLDAPAPLTRQTISLTDDLNGVTIGSLLVVGDETMYVLSASPEGVTATVVRGFDGTTPQAAASGSIVLVDPPWTVGVVRNRLRDEIRSWGPQLFAVADMYIPIVQQQRGYDLGQPVAVAQAAVTGNQISYPFTVTADVNDQFVFTPVNAFGIPQSPVTMSIDTQTYMTDAELEYNLNFDTSGDSSLIWSVRGGVVTVRLSPSGLYPGALGNGATISEGNHGAAALGFLGNPNYFAGGINATTGAAPNIIRILRVSAPQPPYVGSPGYWLTPGDSNTALADQDYSFEYDSRANTGEFPSGKSITLIGPTVPNVVSSLHVVYATPFDVDSSWDDSTDMIADVGIDARDLDIPTLGAAGRLMQMMAARRAMLNVQGQSREDQDVTMQAILQGANQFKMDAQSRRGDVKQRLYSDWPTRVSTY